MKKRIPYSVSDYKKISSGEFYYVDKTRYIEDLENWEVPLFLRPKRFGKSLWCSTLAYYYDINYRDEFEQLFGNTYIGRHPTKSRNSYAVMSFSFVGIVTTGTLEEIRYNFNLCCRDVFLKIIYQYPLLGLTESEVPLDAIEALRVIFRIAQLKGLPPLYIIIDEYDNFTNSLLYTRNMDVYNSVTTGNAFLKEFFKVIKVAIGNGVVGRMFITGVLPVTMDDFTSGFNIASNVSWEKSLLKMAGFAQTEVDDLVRKIFSDYRLPKVMKTFVLEELKANYDGYILNYHYPEGIYNSTICNFYLQSLCTNGELPERTFDDNLAIDRGWFQLLTKVNDKTLDIMMTVLGEGTVKFPADVLAMNQCFNALAFTEKNAILLLFFFLGILTWKEEGILCVPNQNQLVLLGQYCRELQGWTSPHDIIATATHQFKANHDFQTLFSAFWDSYIRLIPSAAFTHLGENFYRTSFFMLCKPNMPKGMDTDIEQNTHSGRYGMRFWGYGLPWWDSHTVLLEFKYRRGDQPLPSAPLPDDIEQIHAYAADQRLLHPEKDMLQYLVYIRGHEEWRLFPVA